MTDDQLAKADLRRAVYARADDLKAAWHNLQAENADLKEAVIAFAVPWAVQWGKEHGLPAGHLHADHYDLLERCGARMVSFTRSEWGGTFPVGREETHRGDAASGSAPHPRSTGGIAETAQPEAGSMP